MSAKPQFEQFRKSLIRQIHIAKKQLSMDDDAYREMLKTTTNQSSLTGMAIADLVNVKHRMVALGFVVKPSTKHGTKPKVPGYKQKQIDKIEALLADAGRPWEYLTSPHRKVDESNGKPDPRSMLERLTGKQKLEFCTQDELGKVVSALQIDQKRRRAKNDES